VIAAGSYRLVAPTPTKGAAARRPLVRAALSALSQSFGRLDPALAIRLRGWIYNAVWITEKRSDRAH
jgi:hypothetical protein